MTIKEAIPIMQSIMTLGKTPITSYNPEGMLIVLDSRGEAAMDALRSSIEDVNNQDQDALQCVNCGLIVSGLLVIEGCPYCSSLKLTTNIETGE